jgi:hypothetical protein
MTQFLKVAATILKETIAHPNKTSTIKVENGKVHVINRTNPRAGTNA